MFRGCCGIRVPRVNKSSFQERRDRVVMKIVARRNPAPDEITALESSVNAVLGSAAEFVTQLVDDIDDEVNGKFRIYRSFVESDYGV